MPEKLPPYDHDHENEVTLFASTNFRNLQRKFGIKTDDRRRHMYLLGKTGMGKTTLMENLILSDIYAGHGLCYIDPHGDAADKLLDYIPSNRINDVVYLNPGDMENPIGFNIFETANENQKHLIASGLMGVFKKIWPDVWSPRMEYILQNTVLALLDAPGSTLLGISRILADDEYRKRVIALIQDPVVKTFWVKEFAAWADKYRTEAIAPVQNKVGQFLSASIIRNIVAQVKSTINLREIMDNRKILIVNLSKGLVGEENMRLLGGMIITKLQMSAMERVDIPEKDRQDFYLFVDEFQNFANESFASILSEARKYRLSLTVGHQYIEQMDEVTRAAVFGNVGTLCCFRVGGADATLLEQEFTPVFTAEDLVNLRKFDIYLRLMIDGVASEPFSATTLPPIGNPAGNREKVIKVSRERYSRQRSKIEDKVLRWSGLAEQEGQEEEVAAQDIISAAGEIGVDEARLKALADKSPKIKEAERPESKKKKEAKYDIPCSVCGEIQKLSFEPDWSRPWYCKEHMNMKDQPAARPVVLKPAAPAGGQRTEARPLPVAGGIPPSSSEDRGRGEAVQGREAGGGKREAGSGRREAGSGRREAGGGKREAGSGKREAGGARQDRKERRPGRRADKPPIKEGSTPVLMVDPESEGLSLLSLKPRDERKGGGLLIGAEGAEVKEVGKRPSTSLRTGGSGEVKEALPSSSVVPAEEGSRVAEDRNAGDLGAGGGDEESLSLLKPTKKEKSAEGWEEDGSDRDAGAKPFNPGDTIKF